MRAGRRATQALDRVVLSGGVFQNRLLLELTVADLRQRGLRVLLPERLPPNDGGIAYGQAAVAAARAAMGLRRHVTRPAYQRPNISPNAPSTGITAVR